MRREDRCRCRKPVSEGTSFPTRLSQKAQHHNPIWCRDFMSNNTQRGGKLRVFNLIDEYTRESHCINADRARPSKPPMSLRSWPRPSNCMEHPRTSAETRWLAEHQVRTGFVARAHEYAHFPAS